MAVNSIRIWNAIHGSDTYSAFEMTRGFTLPIFIQQFISVFNLESITTQLETKARWKVLLLLRSNALQKTDIKVCNTVEVFLKETQKRCKWTSSWQVISIIKPAQSLCLD